MGRAFVLLLAVSLLVTGVSAPATAGDDVGTDACMMDGGDVVTTTCDHGGGGGGGGCTIQCDTPY